MNPHAATPPKRSLVGGVARLLGRVLVLALVGAAGVAGWIGVDQLALAEEEPARALEKISDLHDSLIRLDLIG